MNVITIPKIALALAAVDRPAFYQKLHGSGAVLFIEEERRWIVYSYDLVARLLKHPGLHSHRLQLIGQLYAYADKASVDSFYRQWLMYMDGGAHADWRKVYIAAVSECIAHVQSSVTKHVQDGIGRLSSPAIGDAVAEAVRPMVVGLLADILGLPSEWLDRADATIAPVLDILHGKVAEEQKHYKAIGLHLKAWGELLRRLNAGPEDVGAGGFLDCFMRREKSIDALGVAILPFIDVLDALISLCGTIIAHAVDRHASANKESPSGHLPSLVRLNAPFQVCNRIINDHVDILSDIPYRIGDKISLLIGAANMDPEKFERPDLSVPHAAYGLTFGLGKHSCPGKHWTTMFLSAFHTELLKAVQYGRIGFGIKEVVRQESLTFCGIRQIRITAPHL